MTKIKALIRKFWEMEGIRFLFVSGVNTVVGFLLTLFFGEVLKLPDPLPVVFNYICCSVCVFYAGAYRIQDEDGAAAIFCISGIERAERAFAVCVDKLV